MFKDHEKTRHYAKVIVEWAPVGYTRKFNYGVLITKTNMFTADQIQAVADGAAKNQAIIQGNSLPQLTLILLSEQRYFQPSM